MVVAGQTKRFRDLSDRSLFDVNEWMEMMRSQASGRLDLHNYPTELMELRDGSIHLAVRDILRDRESRIPRYCEFRRQVGLEPPSTFLDMTGGNVEDAQLLSEVYEGDLEAVDLQVGMMTEPKRPGWVVSETAFYIFILMAPRRIQSDERLSSGLTPEKYTQTGYDWVRTQTINDVMRRFQPTYSPGVRFFHV